MTSQRSYLFSDLARLCAVREERRHVIHTARNLLRGRHWIIVLVRERPDVAHIRWEPNYPEVDHAIQVVQMALAEVARDAS